MISLRTGRTGTSPNLRAARDRTAEGLAERRAKLAELEHDEGSAIVLLGSWGRAEITKGSDDDFMLLVAGEEPGSASEEPAPKPTIDQIRPLLPHPPGSQRLFAVPVHSHNLIEKIGLDPDSNTNLSHRMLFLLESVYATGKETYEEAHAAVLGRYMDHTLKNYRPPRFLLNDVIRYWRTIAVDFAGKEHDDPNKWGIRNAKLRTSRKVLFAGGLLPILCCVHLEHAQMQGFLSEQLHTPPVDRIAAVFLRYDAIDAGARTIGAYDRFLSVLDDAGARQELRDLKREDAPASEAFQECKRIGDDLQSGLLSLLFETEPLRTTVRDYGLL